MRTILLSLLAVSAFAQAPVITTSSTLPAAIAVTSYSFTFTATGAATITWSATGLPGSASLSSSGVLTWSSPSVGTTSIHVTATNGTGSDGPHDYALVVLATPICVSVTGGITCGDSGNSLLNGRALEAIITPGPAYSCGDTVTLASGAQYLNFLNNAGVDLVRAFAFHPQSGCTGTKTRFISSALSSIPFTLKADWPAANKAGKQAVIANMAQLVGVPSNTGPVTDTGENVTVNMFPTSNDYYFGGISIVTPLGMQAGSMNYSAMGALDVTTNTLSGTGANNIEIDRCFIGDQEDYIYGSVEDWFDPTKNNKADVNTWETFFRAGNISIHAEGNNWYIHDSVSVNTGFSPATTGDDADPTFTITSATPGNPTIVNSTGIAATLGMAFNAGCNYLSPGVNCYSPNSGSVAGRAIVIRGATGNWAGANGINGMIYAVYVSANSVALWNLWSTGSVFTPIAINSTTYGSLTGTVTGKATVGTVAIPQYNIQSSMGNTNHRYVNNYLSDQGGSSNIFLGGSNTATNNRGNVTTGSTCGNAVTATNTCTLIMSNVVNMNLGDWLWISTFKGEQIGGNLLDITVSSNVATAHFTTLPVGVSIGQAWMVFNTTSAALNNFASNTAPWQVASIGSTSFTFPTTGVADGVYNSAFVQMNPRSPNCPNTFSNNINCSPGFDRVGIITNITGSTVTVTGANAGFSAVDPGTVLDISPIGSAPTWSISTPYVVGDWVTYSGLAYQCLINNTGVQPNASISAWSSYAARWNGSINSYYLIMSNYMQKPYFGYGKAYFEDKQSYKLLFTGNNMCCADFYDFFMEIHKQGNDPWVNGTGTEFSYNVAGGRGGYRFFQLGQDPEASNAPSPSMRMIHNMSTNIPFVLSASTNQIMDQGGGAPGQSISHNTFIPGAGTPSYAMNSGSNVCTEDGISLGTYLQSAGATMTANILGFGVGINNNGVCDPYPTGIDNNVFLNDLGTSMPGWVASQSNTVTTTRAGIGFVGACANDAILNCALGPSSTYKGSMPDGSDPGADVYAVQDRLNQWSFKAGLLIWDQSLAALVNDPDHIFGTKLIYNIVNAIGSCSVQLYDNLARTTLNPDTASGHQACNRAGNTVVGSQVTFNFGTVVPLTNGTTYSYKINDGSNIMVGTFVAGTAPPPSTSSYYTGTIVGTRR